MVDLVVAGLSMSRWEIFAHLEILPLNVSDLAVAICAVNVLCVCEFV